MPLLGKERYHRYHRYHWRYHSMEAQRDEMKYCGIWREGKQFTAGSFVTCDGAMWHANKRTSEKPGTTGDWTLAAKSGNPRANGDYARQQRLK
jgi:hypothetical protein